MGLRIRSAAAAFTDSDASQLSYVTFEGGGSSGQSTLYVEDSAPSLDHLTVRRSGGPGVHVYRYSSSQPLALNTLTVQNSAGDGIYLNDATAAGVTLTNITVSGSGGYGLYSDAPALVVNGATISANAVAASLHPNTPAHRRQFLGQHPQRGRVGRTARSPPTAPGPPSPAPTAWSATSPSPTASP